MRYRVVRGDSVCCVGALGGEKAQVENSGKGGPEHRRIPGYPELGVRGVEDPEVQQ